MNRFDCNIVGATYLFIICPSSRSAIDYLLYYTCLYQVRDITVFTVFRLSTDFVCLYNYVFGLSLCKIVRSSVILVLPLLSHSVSTAGFFLSVSQTFLVYLLL
jgi:hypothetical protein